MGRTLRLEEHGDRRRRIGRQRVTPTDVVQRGVERLGGARLGRTADRGGERLALRLIHQRSSPSARSLRAMMLRWISALPP